MCDTNCCCRNTEALAGKPRECTPEQIRKCHGDSGEHPCTNGESSQENG
jgi:hypothetical protein